MAGYAAVFDAIGLRDWCDEDKKPSLLSLSKLKGEQPEWYDVKFPSLDNLNEACAKIPQTRDMTAGLEEGFLAIRPALRFVLDPLTQPLSWALDAALYAFTASPWWFLVPLLVGLCYLVSKSIKIAGLVAGFLAFFLFTDHYTYAMETLAIIFVCTVICVLIGGAAGYLYVQERSRPEGHHADTGYVANAAHLRVPDSADFLVQNHRTQTLWSCDHNVRHRSRGSLNQPGYSIG